MSRRDTEFSEYVAARSTWLQRTAYLMCGDRSRAEDLAQATLVRLYVAWPRIQRRDAVDAYARRTLSRVCIDEARRPWRRESPTDSTVEQAAPGDGPGQVDERSALLQALRALPPRQRMAVVLRHWHDLSVEETAAAMECTASAVKTHTARGVAALRTALAETTVMDGESR